MHPGEAGFPRHLHWKNAFLFPIETPEARRDVLIGGTLILLLWPIGWVLNLGNRLNVVARLHAGQSPYFTGFRPWRLTLRRGRDCRLPLACGGTRCVCLCRVRESRRAATRRAARRCQRRRVRVGRLHVAGLHDGVRG